MVLHAEAQPRDMVQAYLQVGLHAATSPG